MRLGLQPLGPALQLAAVAILDHVVEIDGTYAGAEQHVADAVGVPGGDGSDRLVIGAPRVRIVAAGVVSWVARLARRLGPLLLSTFALAQFPRPHYPSFLLGERQ